MSKIKYESRYKVGEQQREKTETLFVYTGFRISQHKNVWCLKSEIETFTNPTYLFL